MNAKSAYATRRIRDVEVRRLNMTAPLRRVRPPTKQRRQRATIAAVNSAPTPIANQARRFLGLPISGADPVQIGSVRERPYERLGYDCSGLVYSLYARYGLYLPSDAADQRHAGISIPLAKLSRVIALLRRTWRKGSSTTSRSTWRRARHRFAVHRASVEIIPMTSLPVWNEFAGAIRVTNQAASRECTVRLVVTSTYRAPGESALPLQPHDASPFTHHVRNVAERHPGAGAVTV